MKILNSYFDDQHVVLTAPFCSTISDRNFRAFHTHNCIEIAYVLTGTADQILVFPDGRLETQRLSKGNYVILDEQAKHAYINGSDDFAVMNLLFKSSVLFQPAGDDGRVSGSKASSSAKDERQQKEEENGVEVRVEITSPSAIENMKYVRFWMDWQGDSEEIDFSGARIGVIANGDAADPYLISENVPFYFMGEDDDHWTSFSHEKKDCFEKDQNSSVKVGRGWLAFPLREMYQRKQGKKLSSKDVITGLYFHYSASDEFMDGKYLCIDNIVLTEDYRCSTKKVIYGDKIADFDGSILEFGATGEDRNVAFYAPHQGIKVPAPKSESFYELIREAYPNFDYEKFPLNSMSRVYFDKDGSILPLFKMCYTCSREKWGERAQMIKNGLSLIIMLSLQAVISGEGSGEEDIIETVKNYVDTHYAENITLKEICEKHFYNDSYVCRKFKQVFDCSFDQYLRQVRIKQAGELLLSTQLSIAEIAERCGYATAWTFRRAFVHVTQKTPSEFKKQYKR